MSNLIKASQIAYPDKIRTLDMNERADEITRQYVDRYFEENIAVKQIDFNEVSKKLEEERVITAEDVDFTPGLMGEQVYISEPEEEISPENAVLEVETRLREKKRELEEMQKQIDAAKQEAEGIISEANEKAGEIIESALAEAETQKAEVLAKAHSEGYEQGREAAREETDRAVAELEETKQQFKEDYEKQVEALEPAFVEIVIKYVKKLTGIYAEEKRDIILHLIDNAMKGRHGTENFIIRVSEADFAMASYSRDAIRGYLSDGAAVEVVADKLLAKNQCMIETESRIFDCSLDGQMLSLIEDIRMLAEKE